jgi:hypothetical protein
VSSAAAGCRACSSRDRDVVVKALAPDPAEGLSPERFGREVALAARLQAPHISGALGRHDADGLPYYTMPFVDGQSLRQHLAAGPLPVGEAVVVCLVADRITCGRPGSAARRRAARAVHAPRDSAHIQQKQCGRLRDGVTVLRATVVARRDSPRGVTRRPRSRHGRRREDQAVTSPQHGRSAPASWKLSRPAARARRTALS